VESERQYLSVQKFEEEFTLITFAAFPHPHSCNGLFRGCSPGYSFTFSLSPVRHTPFLRCLYTIYLYPRSYFLSIWLSLVCFLIFSCQSPFSPSPEIRLPSHRFLYFSNLVLFLSSAMLCTHVYRCWFSTQFSVLLLTFYRHFICRYLPFGNSFSTGSFCRFVFVYRLYFLSIAGIRTSGSVAASITIMLHESNIYTV